MAVGTEAAETAAAARRRRDRRRLGWVWRSWGRRWSGRWLRRRRWRLVWRRRVGGGNGGGDGREAVMVVGMAAARQAALVEGYGNSQGGSSWADR